MKANFDDEDAKPNKTETDDFYFVGNERPTPAGFPYESRRKKPEKEPGDARGKPGVPFFGFGGGRPEADERVRTSKAFMRSVDGRDETTNYTFS